MSRAWTAGVFVLAVLATSVTAARHPGFSAIRKEDVPAKIAQAVHDAKNATGNNKPLIGILTQPCHYCPGKSYIAAGYVKLIEMAGGRAVPVRFYASDEELYRIFKQINGLIFPGGLTWLWLDSPYVLAARKLWNWAREENDKGNPFPIHGTCLGHQLLHILETNISRNDLLVDTDSVAHPATLEFTADANSSKFFGALPADLKQKLGDPTLNLALENHMYGIPPAFFDRWPELKEAFTIISTTKDRVGLEYVSTVEHKRYPFTGTQWHPEKPPFEFGMEEIPHTLDAIRISQYIANQIVHTARHSQHRPESKEQELALQIYSTPLIFSARFEVFDDDNYDGPDQTYYFDQKDPEFPPGPDPEDAPDTENPPADQPEAKHVKGKATAERKHPGMLDNRPRRVRMSSGEKHLNPAQLERLFT